jgi:hypothetical protein
MVDDEEDEDEVVNERMDTVVGSFFYCGWAHPYRQ